MNIVAQNPSNYIHSLYIPYILNGIVNIISKKLMNDNICLLDSLLAVRAALLATSSGKGGSAARLARPSPRRLRSAARIRHQAREGQQLDQYKVCTKLGGRRGLRPPNPHVG